MSLETATYISDLNPANPSGRDPIAFLDDHIRLLKAAILATFPHITGPVTRTQDDINVLLKSSGDTMTGPLVLSGPPSVDLHAATKLYVDSLVSGLSGTLQGAKVDKGVSITAGTGLTGGGDLSATRTLALANTSVTPGTYGANQHIPTITVDAQGRITSVVDTATAKTMHVVPQSVTKTLAVNDTFQYDPTSVIGTGTCLGVSVVIENRGGYKAPGSVTCRWLDATGSTVANQIQIGETNIYNSSEGQESQYLAYIPMFDGSVKFELKSGPTDVGGTIVRVVGVTYFG